MRGLTRLHGLPQFVIENSQLRHFCCYPLGFRIEARDASTRLRILEIPLPIPDEPSNIEFVVKDAGAALGMSPQCGVPPELAIRTGYPIRIEPLGYGQRADAVRIVTEYAANDLRFN